MLRKVLLGLLLIAPLSAYPLLRGTETPNVPDPPPIPLTRQQLLETLPLEKLAEAEPVEFLQRCLNRYEKEVTGYICLFDKQERVKGKMRQREKIKIHFCETPFSVHMEWISGNDLLGAKKTLYVAGEETGGFLLARPTIPGLGIMVKPLTDPQVASTSRFPISQFGMYKGAREIGRASCRERV